MMGKTWSILGNTTVTRRNNGKNDIYQGTTWALGKTILDIGETIQPRGTSRRCLYLGIWQCRVWISGDSCRMRSMGRYSKPKARWGALDKVCVWVFWNAGCDSLVSLVERDRWVGIPSLLRARSLSTESAFGYSAMPCVIRRQPWLGEEDGFLSGK